MPDTFNQLEQQLLAEIEDILRTAPPRATIRHEVPENFIWLGRAAALIEQWNRSKGVAFAAAVNKLHDRMGPIATLGYREVMVLLNQAQHDLRMKTSGPLTVPISQGRVFEYFDELRKIIEQAVSEVFFVDAYLDAEFVSRYMPIVRQGVSTRLLTGNDTAKLNRLMPAIDLFVQETGQPIALRSSAGIHDRYLFIDGSSCYHSGASFKDGGKNAGTVLSQITDAFGAMWETYEKLWQGAKVQR